MSKIADKLEGIIKNAEISINGMPGFSVLTAYEINSLAEAIEAEMVTYTENRICESCSEIAEKHCSPCTLIVKGFRVDE